MNPYSHLGETERKGKTRRVAKLDDKKIDWLITAGTILLFVLALIGTFR